MKNKEILPANKRELYELKKKKIFIRVFSRLFAGKK
jgi:hypothetical protein